MLSLFFSFNGRINRSQYWLGAMLGGVLGAVALVGVFGMSGMSLAEAENPKEAIQAVTTFGMLFIPLMAVICWSGLAIQVKRFHDRGRSGFLVLLPMAVSVPMTLSIMGAIATGADPVAIAASAQPYATILWILNLAFFIDLGCMPSNEGPNKYGDPPGTPRGGLTPPAPSPLKPPKNGAEAATSLFGAQSAMDRAIAEKERAPQMQQQRRPAPTPSHEPAAAGAGPRPGAPASFGRRVSR